MHLCLFSKNSAICCSFLLEIFNPWKTEKKKKRKEISQNGTKNAEKSVILFYLIWNLESFENGWRGKGNSQKYTKIGTNTAVDLCMHLCF